MKSGMIRAVLTCVSGLVAVAASAVSVFDDAVFYNDFDYGNQDGLIPGSEVTEYIRDNRCWHNPTAAAQWSDIASPAGGIVIREEDVLFPMRGVTRRMKVGYWTVEKDASTAIFPTILRGLQKQLIGSSSFVMRFRWDGDLGDVAYILNNNLNWSRATGWEFGITTKGYANLLLGQTTVRLHSDYQNLTSPAKTIPNSMVQIPVGKWCDVGVSITQTDHEDADSDYTVIFCIRVDNNMMYSATFATTAPSITPNGVGAFFVGGELRTETASPNAKAKKSFQGSIQSLALWNRALSQSELTEAMAGGASEWQIGFENNSADDLANTGVRSFNVATDAGHDFGRTLSANLQQEIKFTLFNEQHRANRALHGKTLSGIGSCAVTLNGKDLGSFPFVGGRDFYLPVLSDCLQAGENVLKLTPSASMTLDWLEFGGGMRLGLDNNATSEFREACADSEDNFGFDSGAPSAERAIEIKYRTGDVAGEGAFTETDNRALNIHFFLSAGLAAKYEYIYRMKTTDPGGTGGSTESALGSYVPVRILVNGHLVHTVSRALRRSVTEVPIPAEYLVAGDNVVRLEYAADAARFEQAVEDNPNTTFTANATYVAWLKFDYYELTFKKPMRGLVFVVR